MRSPLVVSALVRALLVLTVFSIIADSAAAQSPTTAPQRNEALGNRDALLDRVDQAIALTGRRYLTAGTHTPWQIMHGLLALRDDFQVKENGEKVSALDWMTRGATYQGTHWFEITQYGGRAHPFSKPYIFEGHPNQFLAIFTMSDLPKDYPLGTARGTININGMIHNAQMEVNSREEVTWTLWGLSHYLPPDAQWNNKFGEAWSIERLVQIQTNEPPHNAACGGTHGLFALTYARNQYQKTGQPLRGVWLAADQKIQQYLEASRSLQNSDGTFSSNYYKGRGHAQDWETRLATSGHTLEWVVLALPDGRLQESWVRNGISAVARDLITNAAAPADCGPLYHALDALVLYRDRLQPKPPEKDTVVEAESDETPTGSAVVPGLGAP